MYKYSTSVTLDNPNQLVLSNLPFKPGQKLKINIEIIDEDEQYDELLKRWKKLLKETQELHTDNPLTEAEIIAEINAIRLEQ